MNTVYALVDPRNSEVRYVGCTSSPQKRLWQHRKSHKTGTPVAKWIASLHQEGVKPEMVELESGLNYEKGRESEAFWAVYLKGLGAAILNVRAGDRGVSGVGAPMAWLLHYKGLTGYDKYQELVNNSQPF